jgi:hypothetical protein
MQNYCAGFSLPLCKFGFERTKEATARVTVWREFGVKRSYTMECSFCGFDIGIYKVCEHRKPLSEMSVNVITVLPILGNSRGAYFKYFVSSTMNSLNNLPPSNLRVVYAFLDQFFH